MRKSSYLVIPIAAFALMATNASAFNTDALEKAGLTDDQIEAFKEAQELRSDGDRDGARDVLAGAGIDLDVLDEVRRAAVNERDDHREAIDQAIADDSFDEFIALDLTGPLEVIDTEAEFEKLVEAHSLRDAGDYTAAREIFDELGVTTGDSHSLRGSNRGQYEPAHQYTGNRPTSDDE